MKLKAGSKDDFMIICSIDHNVNIGNYTFCQETIYCGLPRSILDLLLLTLFYNDFLYHVPNSKVTMYADDTVIYVGDKDVNRIEQCLSKDLCNISDYHSKNKLIINLEKSKTKIILFTSVKRLKTHCKLLQVAYQGHAINLVTE